MSEFFMVLVVLTIVVGIYKLFELFVKRKERIYLIEQLGNKLSSEDLREMLGGKMMNLKLPQWEPGAGALKYSLLFIGIAVGFLVAFFVQYQLFGDTSDINREFYYEQKGVLYFASVLLFGGLGLLTAYFISRKHAQNA